jgi:hypothetical protein
MLRRVTVGWLLAVAIFATAAIANAQSGASGTSGGQSSSTTQTSPSSTAPAETRPATTTFFGDTGLWYVPTGEVLAKGKWSVSGYRRGTNYIQGYSNVADFAGTFAFGVKDRAEIFGSFLVDTRIDRDVRPVFVNDANPAKFGGIIDRYPRVNQYWTGDNVGDFYIGAKVNFMSEHENDPAAVALRGLIKLPTGKDDKGVGTGQTDFAIDAIISKEAKQRVEVSGFAGYEWRGSPDGIDIPGGAFRWGAGLGFPSRNPIRFTGEINGVVPSGDTATITAAAPKGIDNTTPPFVSEVEKITRATFGLTFQTKKGVFFGAGVSWNVPTKGRVLSFAEGGDDVFGDYYDWQFRIGYHPGVRVYVPPPPPPAPAPQAAPAAPESAANRPRAVRSVQRRSRQNVDGHGECTRSGWRHADLSVDVADRDAGQPRRAVDGVDRAEQRRHRSGDSDRERRQGRHGERHGEHPGDAARGPQLHVRRRALRLRSLFTAAGSDACSGRGRQRDAAGRDPASHDRRSHLQHRHGRIQPRAR